MPLPNPQPPPPPLLGAPSGVIPDEEAPMVRTNVSLPEPAAFVAERDTLEIPATVGVPVIAPVVVLTDNPAGRPDALNVIGELLAVI